MLVTTALSSPACSARSNERATALHPADQVSILCFFTRSQLRSLISCSAVGGMRLYIDKKHVDDSKKLPWAASLASSNLSAVRPERYSSETAQRVKTSNPVVARCGETARRPGFMFHTLRSRAQAHRRQKRDDHFRGRVGSRWRCSAVASSLLSIRESRPQDCFLLVRSVTLSSDHGSHIAWKFHLGSDGKVDTLATSTDKDPASHEFTGGTVAPQRT